MQTPLRCQTRLYGAGNRGMKSAAAAPGSETQGCRHIRTQIRHSHTSLHNDIHTLTNAELASTQTHKKDGQNERGEFH